MQMNALTEHPRGGGGTPYNGLAIREGPAQKG